AVSREQGRESALEVLDRVPRGSRAELLRSETPLDLARSTHERSEGERGTGRPAGSDRRSPDVDRGIDAPGRGAEGQGRAPWGASGPERGRAQGADRVPGQRDAGRAGTNRTAGLEAGRGSVGDRPAPEGRGAADGGSPLAMLLGGLLAGQVANWRSGAKESARPAAMEPGTSGSRTGPAGARRTTGQGTRPTTRPAP